MVSDVQHVQRVLLSSMVSGCDVVVVVLCSDDVMFVREQIYYLYCVNMVRQDI